MPSKDHQLMVDRDNAARTAAVMRTVPTRGGKVPLLWSSRARAAHPPQSRLRSVQDCKRVHYRETHDLLLATCPKDATCTPSAQFVSPGAAPDGSHGCIDHSNPVLPLGPGGVVNATAQATLYAAAAACARSSSSMACHNSSYEGRRFIHEQAG